MGNLLLNFVLTAALYMLYPIFTVLSKKGKEKYTQAELRNTAIINAVIVKITIMFLTYPNAGSVSPAFFWGYVSYKMMMKHLLKIELPEPEPPVQEQEQQPEPIPATPGKVRVRPVKIQRQNTKTDSLSQSKEILTTPTSEPTSQPQKTSDYGIIYLIATLVIFVIVLLYFGKSSDKPQPINGTENFVVHHSELSLSDKEITEHQSSEINIYFYDHAEKWHINGNCTVLNRITDREIYYVQWKELWPYIPDRDKACQFCKTSLSVNYN